MSVISANAETEENIIEKIPNFVPFLLGENNSAWDGLRISMRTSHLSKAKGINEVRRMDTKNKVFSQADSENQRPQLDIFPHHLFR